MPDLDRNDAAKLQAALTRRLERAQAQTMALESTSKATPEHILQGFGPPPEHPFALERRQRTAAAIDEYRQANDITAPDDLLGPKPSRRPAQREWIRLTHEIRRTGRQLERTIEWDLDVGA